MFQAHLITVDNVKMDIKPMFQKEEEAWAFIVQLMNQPQHPKMMWVTKGEDSNGYALSDRDSSC